MTEDEKVSIIERMFDIKLLAYQKDILRASLRKKKAYIIMPPSSGRVQVEHLMKLTKCILGHKPMISEVIRSDKYHKCCICGRPTKNIEINYQAPFCSDDCITEMDIRCREIAMKKEEKTNG